MPTIDFSKQDLEALFGRYVDEEDMHSLFLPAKGELDGYENGNIKLDIKDSNRPDLWGIEGIVRELKGHLNINPGLPKYKFKKSSYIVTVEGVKNIRPKAAYAVAKNVKITDEFLISLIQMQEKICGSFGRKRKEVAIGIFDLDKVHGKKLRYYGADKAIKFSPLGFTNQMSLEQILKEHPKGKEYAHLLQGCAKYPLLVDEKNEVLSMPPVINSENSGKVELTTKNLFLDVTGFDQDVVNAALLILCMALTDRGCDVQTANIIYKDENNKTIQTPYIQQKTLVFDKKLVYDYFQKLSDKEIKELLERKRYKVGFTKDKIKATYLNHRTDVMHPVDIIEDMLISYGFYNIQPEELAVKTTGNILEKTEWQNLVREATLGFGLQEVMTFTLTSKQKQYANILTKGQAVEIANPMSELISIFRERIFPEHLDFLSRNQHITYPQNVFEVGQALETDGKEVFEKTKLCVTLCYNGVSYTRTKQILDGILRNIGATNVKFKTKDFGWFINGRSAEISFKIDGKEKRGFIGELNPQVLENFNLEMPVALFEIEVNKE